MTLLCYSQENLPSPPITPLSILYKIYTRDQNIEVDKKISILSTFLTFLRLKWSENFGKICIFSLPKSQKLIKNERKSLIWIIKVVNGNILNFCAFFGFGVGVKRVGKIKGKSGKSILCSLERTRTYSNLLERTRNVHKYVISSFRLCFLLIFCKSGAGVEWSGANLCHLDLLELIIIYSKRLSKTRKEHKLY